MGSLSRQALEAMAEETVVDAYSEDERAGFTVMLKDNLGLPFAPIVLDLPLPSTPPAGSEWIEAWRQWGGRA